jgi:hypothetical protein
VISQCDLRDLERLKEFLEKNLAGVGWDSVLRQHRYSLAIVLDLDIMGISALPPQDDPPSLIIQ